MAASRLAQTKVSSGTRVRSGLAGGRVGHRRRVPRGSPTRCALMADGTGGGEDGADVVLVDLHRLWELRAGFWEGSFGGPNGAPSDTVAGALESPRAVSLNQSGAGAPSRRVKADGSSLHGSCRRRSCRSGLEPLRRCLAVTTERQRQGTAGKAPPARFSAAVRGSECGWSAPEKPRAGGVSLGASQQLSPKLVRAKLSATEPGPSGANRTARGRSPHSDVGAAIVTARSPGR